MNKKQNITFLLTLLALITIVALTPRYKIVYLDDTGKNYMMIYQGNPLYKRCQASPHFDWDKVIRLSIPVLVIGVVLIIIFRGRAKETMSEIQEEPRQESKQEFVQETRQESPIAPIAPENNLAEEEESEDIIVSATDIIKAPQAGRFYYMGYSQKGVIDIRIGKRIDTDQIVGIIESEGKETFIKSQVKGKVINILVRNGQFVGFSQPLFLIELL